MVRNLLTATAIMGALTFGGTTARASDATTANDVVKSTALDLTGLGTVLQENASTADAAEVRGFHGGHRGHGHGGHGHWGHGHGRWGQGHGHWGHGHWGHRGGWGGGWGRPFYGYGNGYPYGSFGYGSWGYR